MKEVKNMSNEMIPEPDLLECIARIEHQAAMLRDSAQELESHGLFDPEGRRRIYKQLRLAEQIVTDWADQLFVMAQV